MCTPPKKNKLSLCSLCLRCPNWHHSWTLPVSPFTPLLEMGTYLHAVEYREIPLSLQLLSFSTLFSPLERDTLPETCRIPITCMPSLYPAHVSLCNSLPASPNGSAPSNISSRCYGVKWTPVRSILLCLRKQIQACEAICSCRVAILIFLCTMCNKEHYQISLSNS